MDSPTKESQKPKKENDGLSCDGFSQKNKLIFVINNCQKLKMVNYLSTSESDSLGNTSHWDDEEKDISPSWQKPDPPNCPGFRINLHRKLRSE